MIQSTKIVPDWWQSATLELSKKDEVLSHLIQKYQANELTLNDNLLEVLCSSIISQQISTKAASAIKTRLNNQIGMNIKALLSAEFNHLRQVGLSSQKIGYLKNIASFMQSYNKPQTFDLLANDLIKIKGVGSWTINMVGLFYWGKSDILPISDLGLLRAFARNYLNYELNKSNQKQVSEKLQEHSKIWNPHQTLATWYLWRSIDPEPVSF